jgi:hypothetical protein
VPGGGLAERGGFVTWERHSPEWRFVGLRFCVWMPPIGRSAFPGMRPYTNKDGMVSYVLPFATSKAHE